MAFKVDFSSIRTVRVHKEQFEAIDKKANIVMITCIEDGRVIPFNRVGSKAEKSRSGHCEARAGASVGGNGCWNLK
ncbi:hypothetical protein DXC26_00510 [Clostridiaceae bacterium OM08-6BH]|nr:hypothetical protein DXC26_00510 [Clostridiaceae bacterium OM08-6BH]